MSVDSCLIFTCIHYASADTSNAVPPSKLKASSLNILAMTSNHDPCQVRSTSEQGKTGKTLGLSLKFMLRYRRPAAHSTGNVDKLLGAAP